MSYLVANPEDRFSHEEAHILPILDKCLGSRSVIHKDTDPKIFRNTLCFQYV